VIESVVGPNVHENNTRLIHPLKTDLTLDREEIKRKLLERERDFLNDRGLLNFTKWLWPVSPRVEHVEYQSLRRQIFSDQNKYIQKHVD